MLAALGWYAAKLLLPWSLEPYVPEVPLTQGYELAGLAALLGVGGGFAWAAYTGRGVLAFLLVWLAAAIAPFNRRPGGRDPGGWWLLTEIHVEYPRGEIYCHDAAGWRRDRLTDRPSEWPVRVRPDWVCEILSESNASNDTVRKLRALHRAGVPHYWLLDPERLTLTVLRWTRDGYLEALSATWDETVRAEPFDAIELSLSTVFGR